MGYFAASEDQPLYSATETERILQPNILLSVHLHYSDEYFGTVLYVMSRGFQTTTAWLGLATGTGRFRIWRTAATMSSKQSRTALKEWSSSFDGREGTRIHHRK
jgi:hypothetical protein